jgi:hypothetical protein
MIEVTTKDIGRRVEAEQPDGSRKTGRIFSFNANGAFVRIRRTVRYVDSKSLSWPAAAAAGTKADVVPGAQSPGDAENRLGL